MSEMIERLTQVVAGLLDGTPREIAEGVVRAMREPTEAMIDAAYVATEFNDRWQIEDAADFIKAWRAGLDEAFK